MKLGLMIFSLLSLGLLGLSLLEPSKMPPRINPEIVIAQRGPSSEPNSDTPGLEDKLSLVENYLYSSGMQKNFSVPSLILQKHLDSQLLATRLSNEEREKLIAFFENRLNSENIEKFVKNELLNSFSEEELLELNRLYEIDLLKKVTSIEEYYSSDEALEKADLFFKDPQNLNLSPNRIRLLDQLIQVQEADLQAQTITLESIKGLHRGLKRILPKEKRISDEKVDLAVDILQTTPGSRFKNTILLRYQYSHRDLSELELKNLIELSDNKLIRKARQASMAGIKKAFLTI